MPENYIFHADTESLRKMAGILVEELAKCSVKLGLFQSTQVVISFVDRIKKEGLVEKAEPHLEFSQETRTLLGKRIMGQLQKKQPETVPKRRRGKK